jgi:hypothetical protein
MSDPSIWLQKHWQHRAVCELRVSSFFATLYAETLRTGAHPNVLELIARAPADELGHAKVCLDMVAHYGGEPVWPEPCEVPLTGPNVSREDLVTLALVGHCCINETIATAWLQSCFAMAREPAPRKAIRTLLADEIDHARIGWAHLASKELGPRALVQRCLSALVRANWNTWTRHDPDLPSEGAPDHGVPPPAETKEIVRAAIRDLVIPGFDRLGFDTRSAKNF